MSASIDLNADLGEGMASDAALLEIVSSASVSCGAHAGDEASIRAALSTALRYGVTVGAHPGFPDRAHFGRRRLDLTRDELRDTLTAQLDRFAALAEAEGVESRFVKLHGAMANMAAEDRDFALAAFEVVARRDRNLGVLAIGNSRQVEAARSLGLKVVAEAFADRAYGDDGQLLPRGEAGALITDEAAVVERCLRLASKGKIVTRSGGVLGSEARSICLHGDTPGAFALAEAVRSRLEAAGIAIRSEF